MTDSILQILKLFGVFGGIFFGLWLIKRIIRFFGPALKMIGYKPYK